MPLDNLDDKVVTADFSGIGKQAGKTDWSISAQWASRPDDQRYTSLGELMGMLDRRSRISSERTVRLGDITPRLIDGREFGFEVEGDGNILRPTNYSFQQLGSALKIPTGFVKSTLYDEPEIVERLMTKAITRLEDPDQEIGLYRSGLDMRGITGPKYGRVMDMDVVRELDAACRESGAIWEVPTAFAMPGTVQFECVDPTKEQTTLYASDRDVCLFLVDQRNPIEAGFVTDPKTGGRVPDVYSRGIVVRNGECGGVALSVTTFLYRWVCMNRSIREQKGFQKVSLSHRSGVRDAFMKTLVPAMKAFVNGSAVGVADEIQRAKDQALVRNDDEARYALEHTFGFSPDVAQVIMGKSMAEDQRPIRSSFDMVQAMTAAARAIPHQDKRMQVEREAGRILANV